MIRLLRGVCLMIAFVTLFSRPLFALDSARPVVRIIIAGGSAATTDLLLARLKHAWVNVDATIVTNVVPAMTRRDVLAPPVATDKASVWIDLSAPRIATLFVVDAGNVFEREVSFDQGFDSVALELLDVVTTGAVQAVLAGEHLGVTREEFTSTIAPAPAPAPSAARDVPRRVAARARSPHLVAGITYQGTMLAPHRYAHGPGLEAQLEWARFLLGIELRARFPYQINDAGEALSLAPQGIRLSVGLPLSIEQRLRCVLSLGGGIDITRVHPSSSNTSIDSPSPFWSVTPVISPLLRMEYLLEKFRAALLLGADLDLGNTSYVVSTSQAAVPVWTPWRARPVAGAALSYAF